MGDGTEPETPDHPRQSMHEHLAETIDQQHQLVKLLVNVFWELHNKDGFAPCEVYEAMYDHEYVIEAFKEYLDITVTEQIAKLISRPVVKAVVIYVVNLKASRGIYYQAMHRCGFPAPPSIPISCPSIKDVSPRGLYKPAKLL